MEGGAAQVDGRLVVGDKLVAVRNALVSLKITLPPSSIFSLSRCFLVIIKNYPPELIISRFRVRALRNAFIISIMRRKFILKFLGIKLILRDNMYQHVQFRNYPRLDIFFNKN